MYFRRLYYRVMDAASASMGKLAQRAQRSVSDTVYSLVAYGDGVDTVVRDGYGYCGTTFEIIVPSKTGVRPCKVVVVHRPVDSGAGNDTHVNIGTAYDAATPEHMAAVRDANKALTAQVEELLKVEIEFEQKALPLTLLVDREGKELDIEVGHLQALWWLFADEG